MSWHRTDDSASLHPKLGKLADDEARALAWGLWLYCARNRTEGTFTLDDLPHMAYLTPKGPRAVTTQMIRRFTQLRLVDDHGNGTLSIHDFRDYNPKDPTAADRMKKHRAEQRAREQAETQQHDRNNDRNNDRNDNVTQPVTHTVTKPSPRARAPRPVPVPLEDIHQQHSNGTSAAAENDIDLEQLGDQLQAAGWTTSQQDAAAEHPGLAAAWLERAAADSTVRNRGAFAWQGFVSGVRPALLVEAGAPLRSVRSDAYPDPAKRLPCCDSTTGEGHREDCPAQLEAARQAAELAAQVELEPVDVEANAAKAAALLQTIKGG